MGINPIHHSDVEMREVCDRIIQTQLDERNENVDVLDRDNVEAQILYLMDQSDTLPLRQHERRFVEADTPQEKIDAQVVEADNPNPPAAAEEIIEERVITESAAALNNAILDIESQGTITKAVADNLVVLFQLHPFPYSEKLQRSISGALSEVHNKLLVAFRDEPRRRVQNSSDVFEFKEEELQAGMDVIKALKLYASSSSARSKHPFDIYLESRMASPNAKEDKEYYRNAAYEKIHYIIVKAFENS